jgi:hypothetical protein
MVANEDVGLSTYNSFAITDLVRDKIQYAINTRPAFDKEMCNNDGTHTEQRRNKKAGEEKDHEGYEYQ